MTECPGGHQLLKATDLERDCVVLGRNEEYQSLCRRCNDLPRKCCDVRSDLVPEFQQASLSQDAKFSRGEQGTGVSGGFGAHLKR